MLTPQDVRSVQFEKNLRGYRTEDVDRFLDKVEEQLQQNDAQAEQLRKQIADLTAENQKLKGELQSFEADGDMLKSALINAQRMGENVIREANQKAEEIIHRANLRGDDIIRDANELLQKAGKPAQLTLSAETRPIRGGVVLKNGLIETNCSLGTLVDGLRPELSGKVAARLFG